MPETNELAIVTQQRDRLRAALAGLVGADSAEELTAMEAVIRIMPAPDADKVAMLNAIHVLLDTQ